MRKILVIDDEKEIVNLIQKELQEDYEVLTAYNGHDGLHILEKNEISLVILDIMMPGMDGYHTCSVQKQRTAIKHLDFPAAGTIILRSHFPTVN